MTYEVIMSVILAVGLAAACGFRVFLPLFAVSLMSYLEIGTFGLSDNFEWIGTVPAMVAFGGATLLELAGYYVPYIDNLLDSIAIPLAAVAGTVISLSTMMDLEPLLQWSIALIAGGGLAGLIKGTGAATRALSTATTGGVANPVISTVETSASIGMVLLAVFIPVMALLAIAFIIYLLYKAIKRLRRKKASSSSAHQAEPLT
ncbi:MAG: DUF4126 domain-containing protein [Flavobacteriales bacterium]|nr:DUF4126 domain-containing protein [Flavobacteriales bacterium]